MVLDKLRANRETATFVRVEELTDLISGIFQKLNIPEEDAKKAADVLVLADLRGVDSHGVANYMEMIYVPGLTGGRINPRPHISIVHQTPATALVDGDSGIGLVVGQWAMNLAIQKASEVGAGFVAVRNSRHYGMAGYYAMMALAHHMIGISMTNAGPAVLPTFGREPRMGTNPLSLAAPAGHKPPFVLDMATSTVAMGKVIIASNFGVPLPLGWAADDGGNPTTDPAKARESRKLLPLGGTREQGSHKGYSLAVMVDILCGILSGAGASIMMSLGDPVGHFFAAIRIDAFRPPEEFEADMEAMLQGLKDTPPAEGQEQVYYAGLIEDEVLKERKANGIPLPPHTIEYLKGISNELDMPFRI